MRACAFIVGLVVMLAVAGAQPREAKYGQAAASDHASQVSQVIDQAVNPAQLPAGYMGIMVGYLDDSGPVYKSYGKATVDGTVQLNEKTVFGVGSMTKLFAASLLAIANVKGLALTTAAVTLLPPQGQVTSTHNRYGIRLLDLADHHAGLPKNEGHLFNSLNDLYSYYAADPITCNPATAELVHDCGCCDPVYMSLLGLTPTCGAGVANPVYSCATHTPTQGPKGWVYSNLAFEVLGSSVATWLGYPNWNQANLQEITLPLSMPDTMPLESFGQSQIARAANHCSPATRTTNPNCQLLDWLPVGNAAGGLFSTAADVLQFLSYNAYGTTGTPPNARLTSALPIIHQIYEHSPGGGQELGWQTVTLPTGEVEHWKDGANGPFHSWVGYVTGPMTRMIVILDNSGSNNADLGPIGSQVLVRTGPSISSSGIVNAASFQPSVAPGSLASIFGSNFISTATSALSVPLPMKLGTVTVTIDGRVAPMLYAGSNQINFQVPFETSLGTTSVIVTVNGVNSAPAQVTVSDGAPGIFVYNSNSSVVQNQDYSLNGPGNPAKVGSFVTLYATGLGAVSPSVVSGGPPGDAVSSTTLKVTATINNLPAPVSFSGLTPGFVGLDQVNIQIPDLAAGTYTIKITAGTAVSNAPTISVMR